ncbi:MAG: hypothetical protein V3U31_03845 [Dehalococcoidia bacterium]
MDKKTKTQKTPTGYEIPVPTREEVMRDLAKVAKPAESTPRRPKK